MDEERKEGEQTGEETDESRRELLSKLITAAGAVAATGLVAGALDSEAEGAEIKRVQRAPLRAARVERLAQSQLQYRGLPKGHSFELGGKQLSQVLAREGLISKDLAGAGAVMTIKLEWS